MNSLPQQPNTPAERVKWTDRKPDDTSVKQAAADGNFAVIEKSIKGGWTVYGYFKRGVIIAGDVEPDYNLTARSYMDINCTCPDHMGRGRDCKHIVALRLQLGGTK